CAGLRDESRHVGGGGGVARGYNPGVDAGSPECDPFFGRRSRDRSRARHDLAKASTQVKIIVPGSQPMVALLGQRDELLKLVESAFDSQILVRGNEITISGPDGEAEKVGQLFEELLELLARGHV